VEGDGLVEFEVECVERCLREDLDRNFGSTILGLVAFLPWSNQSRTGSGRYFGPVIGSKCEGDGAEDWGRWWDGGREDNGGPKTDSKDKDNNRCYSAGQADGQTDRHG
jgi:hypothetical protein